MKTAGDIFTEQMNKILAYLERVNVDTDDIQVYGSTIKEHNSRLKAMLDRARQVNLKRNPKKSKICQNQVEYVGHTLTSEGLKPMKDRIQAIVEMPTPTSKAGIQRFLGMVGYVSKFIPNLAEISKPIRLLLSKEMAWHWEESQSKAFIKLKEALTNVPVLRYYNVHEQTVLQVDASKSGLGATLMQKDHPIAMASKALNDTQINYAVIEKELLAICFGCQKMHDYIFGKKHYHTNRS